MQYKNTKQKLISQSIGVLTCDPNYLKKQKKQKKTTTNTYSVLTYKQPYRYIDKLQYLANGYIHKMRSIVDMEPAKITKAIERYVSFSLPDKAIIPHYVCTKADIKKV